AAAEARVAAQRGDHDHAVAKHKLAASYQAPGAGLSEARGYLCRGHGRPRRLGRGHPPPASPGHRCRRRTPPPPRPVLLTAALLPNPSPVTRAQRNELALTPDQPPGEKHKWVTDLAGRSVNPAGGSGLSRSRH